MQVGVLCHTTEAVINLAPGAGIGNLPPGSDILTTIDLCERAERCSWNLDTR